LRNKTYYHYGCQFLINWQPFLLFSNLKQPEKEKKPEESLLFQTLFVFLQKFSNKY